MAAETKRTRSERIEVRATPEDRELINQAVAAANTDLTTFVIDSLTVAARRILADRTQFALGEDGRAAWDAINERPPRDLPGLSALMRRPSPFVDG